MTLSLFRVLKKARSIVDSDLRSETKSSGSGPAATYVISYLCDKVSSSLQ